MACYYGLSTNPNRVMWLVFVLFVVAGCVMLPLGLAEFIPCYNRFQSCLDRYPGIPENDWRNPCRPQFDDCAITWARLTIVGAICLAIATVPQCYFCCCSKPPLKPNHQQYVGQAVVLPPYGPPSPAAYPAQLPPGGYSPVFQPVPGGPQNALPPGVQPYPPGNQFYPNGNYNYQYGNPYPAYQPQQPAEGVPYAPPPPPPPPPPPRQ